MQRLFHRGGRGDDALLFSDLFLGASFNAAFSHSLPSLPPPGLGQGELYSSDIESPTFWDAKPEARTGHACTKTSKTQLHLDAPCFCLLVGHPCLAFLFLRIPCSLNERWTR